MRRSIRLFVVALLCGAASKLSLAQTRPVAEPLPLTVFKNLQAGQKQTVVVYGTSLTAGGAWADAVQAYFDRHFPGQVTFVNAAKNGMHSDWGVENIGVRVMAKQPDLVFIEFAVNDASAKNNISQEKSAANLGAMVGAIRRLNPKTDIVLQTMNPAWDSPANPQKKYGSDRPNLSAYYDVARRYAGEHNLPLVDNEPAWRKQLADNAEQYHAAVPDGIHPNKDASLATTWPAVEAMLEKARTVAAGETPR